MNRPRHFAIGLAAAVLACLLPPAPAKASGDFGCTARWALSHAMLTACDSMAMLAPANDTRINLALLLSAAPLPATPPAKEGSPASPLFDWATFATWAYPSASKLGDRDHAAGEGSRCLGDPAAATAFEAAVAGETRLTAAERATLIAARRALRPTCVASPDPAPATPPPPPGSGVAPAFVTYLQGADAFYAGRFDVAAARFAALADSDQPWLRETARYMLGRVEVNRAQIGLFDDYGYRDATRKADPAVIARAGGHLLDYLRAYPGGRYAGSARGLLRRVHWLGDDTARLAAEYAALFAGARGPDDAALAEEIDDKLLPHLTAAETTDPILLALLDLRAMRRGDADDEAPPPITRAALEAQRPKFARAPALFDHLLATHAFFVAEDPRAVLRLIPAEAVCADPDSVRFSRQALRGMALDAVHDPAARDHWLGLLAGAPPPLRRVTVELALALHDERAGAPDRVFAAGSPVRDATIRDILLTNVAGPALLRRQAATAPTPHERGVAAFTLLYKQVTRGAYRGFVTDLVRAPATGPASADLYGFVGAGDAPVALFTTGRTSDEFACPVLRQTATRLAAAPADPTARLCLAEFVRLNGLDGFFLDTQPPAGELGGTATAFPGTPFARLEVYKALIADRRTPPDDRAYALHRAIRCYAPSRNNGCGGGDVAPSVRRAWFLRLKRDHARSRWARDLDYYW